MCSYGVVAECLDKFVYLGHVVSKQPSRVSMLLFVTSKGWMCCAMSPEMKGVSSACKKCFWNWAIAALWMLCSSVMLSQSTTLPSSLYTRTLIAMSASKSTALIYLPSFQNILFCALLAMIYLMVSTHFMSLSFLATLTWSSRNF